METIVAAVILAGVGFVGSVIKILQDKGQELLDYVVATYGLAILAFLLPRLV